MKVIEEYDTIQGEGRYTGFPSRFIRTTGCNLRCAWNNPDGTTTICDTPYSSYNPEVGKNLDVKKSLEELSKTNIKHIVITGGEPTLQSDLPHIVESFTDAGYRVTIETNGTRYFDNMRKAFISLSPKLKSSYAQIDPKMKAIHMKNNNWIPSAKEWMKTNGYQFKFVGNDQGDLLEILEIQKILNIPKDKIYIMPQGITSEQLRERESMLVDFCMKHGMNFSQRLHIDLWGNKRGV